MTRTPHHPHRRRPPAAVALPATPSAADSLRRALPWLLALVGMTALVTSVADAQPTTAPTPVVVDHVRSQPMVQAMPISGTVHTRNQMQITAPVAGRLAWAAEPGTSVAAGEAVARIDTGPLVLQRAEQAALLTRQRTNLAHLEQELQRRERLSQSDYVSELDLDTARAQRDLAAVDIRVAEARLAQLDDQIRRAEIIAPFDGMVTEQARYAGEELVRGATISQLIDTRALEVRAGVPMRYLGHTRSGDVLTVRAGTQEWLGRIRTVIAAGDTATQTFEVRVDLPDAAHEALAVGQLLRVRVPITETTARMSVPRDAVVLRTQGAHVFRIGSDSTAERIAVQLGAGQGRWVSVTGELTDGDRVAVRGAERLRDGAQVNVVRDLAADPERRSAG